MALRKTLAERLFNITKTSRRALTNYRISSTAAAASRISQNPTRNNAPDPGDNGVFRRFLHKAAMFQPTISPVGGENLMEKLITIDIARDRIRLDGLCPPPTMKAAEKEKEKAEGLTVEEAKKVLRAVKMEMVKDRLRMIERNWIPYSEFVRVCEEACSDRELGLQFAKSLDDAGNVIVLGNVVFLKPEQVNFVSILFPLKFLIVQIKLIGM